jgi:hypothetical protein
MNLFKIIAENYRLRRQNTKLAVQNIILRADLRIIADDPESPKAKPIIAKYKKELEIEREVEQASQN